MEMQPLRRQFRYNSVRLEDPSPAMSLTQVRDFFASVYPEIISADIDGPELSGDLQVYTFRRAVGTKGDDHGPANSVIDLRWPLLLAELSKPELREVAVMDVLAFLAPSEANSCHIRALVTHRMAALGWRCHVLHRDGVPQKFFMRPEGPSDELRKKIGDLAALEQIGWFQSEGRTATFIRITQEFAQEQPGFALSPIHIARINSLHAEHCSRTAGDLA